MSGRNSNEETSESSPSSRGWHEFHGPNAAYVLDLYDRYSRNRDSVDPETRAYFDAWTPVDRTPMAALPNSDTVVAAVHLAQAIREYGHLAARLDPLGTEPVGDPALELGTYELRVGDLKGLPASIVGGPVAERSRDAQEAIDTLREVYCSSVGYNYAHIRAPQERAWLRHAAESRRFHPNAGPFSPLKVLERLTQIEVFEHFLHSIFPGKTRFSIEGLDMLVLLLDELLVQAAEGGISAILVGMAHRGRLNVLVHVLNKPYAQILAEFKDPLADTESALRVDLGWMGDVKYHLGACRAIASGTPQVVTVCMVPNPSHLEFVNPVVEGMARAAGTRVDSPGAPRFNPSVSLPVVIHGDASFPGQGVVAETLNLSRLPGYTTGGTVHIIANNQLGFTTDPRDSRSTMYASDLAKGFEIPVVHVNADDPEACIEGIRLAFAYRAKFRKDFLVDLVGYRRHGHNEGDEPRFTQPRLYDRVDGHPTVRQLWARKLEDAGLVDSEQAETLVRKRQEELRGAWESLDPTDSPVEPLPASPPPGAARKVKTAVPIERLQALCEAVTTTPPGFRLHPRLRKVHERRRAPLEDPDARVVDWGLAETLALGSILEDGTSIRFTGEDVERGTFSHRHAKLYDAETSEGHVPLQALRTSQAAFELVNSPLTESATIGFEYGYAVQTPERLVIWEAQYGDFINVAQVMIDEFLMSARAKWGQTPSLVLLLPHGYEGQGPDHSSGRVERFLNLSADVNARVANCTTAAQYFHLLRRQGALLRVDPLPLVVLTPKSLLRHPSAASTLRELAEGIWLPVIDDELAREHADQVRRLVLVSGKVYVDLVSSEERERSPHVAIARVEQLYPLHAEPFETLFDGYRGLEEVVWLQEEPQNMGGWRHVGSVIEQFIDGRWPLRYLGRRAASSPAEGSTAWHQQVQQSLVHSAFQFDKVSVETYPKP